MHFPTVTGIFLGAERRSWELDFSLELSVGDCLCMSVCYTTILRGLGMGLQICNLNGQFSLLSYGSSGIQAVMIPTPEEYTK